MKWKWRGRETGEVKLLEALAVPDEHPVLQGVLTLVRARREASVQLAMLNRQSAEDRAWVCGRIAMAEDVEKMILEAVERAREKKEGREG